jgi:anti-sigma factor RsiW
MGAGDEVSFVPVRNHIETCLNCQASLARQRRVRRSLEDLSSIAEAAPVAAMVLGVESQERRAKPSLVGAIAAALVVGVSVFGLRRALAD